MWLLSSGVLILQKTSSPSTNMYVHRPPPTKSCVNTAIGKEKNGGTQQPLSCSHYGIQPSWLGRPPTLGMGGPLLRLRLCSLRRSSILHCFPWLLESSSERFFFSLILWPKWALRSLGSWGAIRLSHLSSYSLTLKGPKVVLSSEYSDTFLWLL